MGIRWRHCFPFLFRIKAANQAMIKVSSELTARVRPLP